MPVPLTPVRYRIFGVTRDSGLNVLAGCTVDVFSTQTNVLVGQMVSDSGGNYSVDVDGGTGQTFYAVAYKPGSPDVAGTTVNTLVGV